MKTKKNKFRKINFSNLRAQIKPGIYEVINVNKGELSHYILNIKSNFYISRYNSHYLNSRFKSHELVFLGEIVFFRGNYNLIYSETQYRKEILCNYVFFTKESTLIRKITSPE